MTISPDTKQFDLAIRDDVAAGHVRFLRKNLLLAHSQLGSALRELSLAMVSARTMAGLHKRFMNISGATDVLTFELERDRKNRVISGEVIICPAVAVSAAKAHGVALRDELLLYALHGMLHLCGFDDRTARQFKIMHDREDQILAQLGIGPIFQNRREEQ
jgi:probable rRNA maturation factor